MMEQPKMTSLIYSVKPVTCNSNKEWQILHVGKGNLQKATYQ